MESFTDLRQDVLIGASLAVAIVLSLIIFYLFRGSSNAEKKVASSARGSGTKKVGDGSGKFTAAEVALHNKADDCWLIVDNKVYDVTSYVEEHPGGDSILNNAGADSTEGFKGPQHPARVFEHIDLYYIGDLVG